MRKPPKEVVMKYLEGLVYGEKRDDIPSHMRVDENGCAYDPAHGAILLWGEIKNKEAAEKALKERSKKKGYVWKKEDYILNQEYLDAKIG
jgi:hypothetical protein